MICGTPMPVYSQIGTDYTFIGFVFRKEQD